MKSGSWWWTGRPGVLQFMGLQRVGHDWATELNWTVCLFHETLLFQYYSSDSHSVASDSLPPLRTVAHQAPVSMGFSRLKNTGVRCHALLQGIFPAQGLKPDLAPWGQILYQMSHQGSPLNIIVKLTKLGHNIDKNFLHFATPELIFIQNSNQFATCKIKKKAIIFINTSKILAEIRSYQKWLH